jgi:hypothetical protein
MFLRQAARSGLFAPVTRSFAAPVLLDKGFNPVDLVYTRSAKIEDVELTEENYWDHIDHSASLPSLIYCHSRYVDVPCIGFE